MKFLVALKPVLSEESKAYYLPKKGFIIEHPSYVLNPYDEFALEEALRLKDNYKNIEITSITLGPPEFENAIRTTFCYPVDKGIHIVVNSKIDAIQTAEIMAKCIKIDYDLLLFGKMSVDKRAAMTGPLVAHHLGLPQITAANRIEVNDSSEIIVHRKINGIKEILKTRLPAVVTIDRVEKPLRYYKYVGYSKRFDKQIKRIEINDNEIPEALSKVYKITNTKPFKKEDLKWLKFSAAEKIRHVMSGGINQQKKGKILEGSNEQLASELIHFLSEQNFI